jgi:hypothetical protein
MLLSVFFFGVTEFGAPYQYRAHSRRRAAVRDHMALRRSRLTHRVTSHTSSLRTRGDQFDKAFVVEAAGGGHTFGSFECAIQAIAPITSMAIASETTCNELSGEVDQIICATTPRPFFAVGTSTATLHRYTVLTEFHLSHWTDGDASCAGGKLQNGGWGCLQTTTF